MDALLLVVVREGVLLEVGMTFYLMDSRNDAGFLDQPLEFTFAEVGNADCAGFPALEAFLHGFVCVDVVAVAGLGLTVGVFREHL